MANGNKTDNLEYISSKWKTDSLGCSKYRNIDIFEKLLNGYALMEKSKDTFLSVLGKPNNIEIYDNRIVIIYYYNSICDNEKLLKNADKSSIRISFDLQKKYKDFDTRIE